MRILFIALLTILVAGIAVAGFFYLSRNNMAHKKVQQYGQDALNVNFEVGSVYLNLLNNTITLTDVKVANPPGYNNDNAISIEHVYAQYTSLFSDIIHFEKLDITNTNAYLEVSKQGTNLAALYNRITQNRQASQQTEALTGFQINAPMISFRGTFVKPSAELSWQDIKPISIPDFYIQEQVYDESGVPMQRAIQTILFALIERTLKNADQSGFLKQLETIRTKSLNTYQGTGTLTDPFAEDE